ncbi:MAG: TenA family transcriptional regulator [Roseivirga sp.]|nr:TenA family transcriptional regulator [Roseivirga sp.]
MKNNRAIQLPQETINLHNLSTAPPPENSLFWKMWHTCEDIAQGALATKFVQGIGTGTLHPQTYGAFNVSDAYYCFNGAADYQTAVDKATNPVLKAFLQHKHDSYESYNNTFPDTWRVKNGDSIVPTAVCKAYSDFESNICANEEAIYALVVMLPCEYLWIWLGQQLAPAKEGNLYSDWITGNQDPSGAFAMGNFINAYQRANPIDEDKALAIYKQAITYERDNFATA